MILRGGVMFIPEIPRNPRGKILRRKLKEILSENEHLLPSPGLSVKNIAIEEYVILCVN